jgi:hypothetical protein
MSMDIEKHLNKKISYQKDTWSSLSKELTISQVLQEFKGDIYKSKIEALRNLIKKNDIESYKAEKLKLPAVTFCGTFDSARRKEELKEYNELIVIDIDKLETDEMYRVSAILLEEDFVFSFWTSPSNNGVKGLVTLKYNYDIGVNIDLSHKTAFYKLSDYFFQKHNIILDNSGNDTTRLCFVSWDKDIVIKNKFSHFEIDELDLKTTYESTDRVEKNAKIKKTNKRDALYNPSEKNKNHHRRDIKKIIDYLIKRKISITDEYENRYKIGYAISNSFTYDIGVKYFLTLCQINSLKFNETKAIKLLEYCYENNTGWIKFNFIEELVKNKGYKKTMEKSVS